mgnify:CR=1 FL=1|jgi:predicted membrane protein
MKFHPVNSLIAIVVSALLTYGIYSIDTNLNKTIISVGAFIFFATTLSVAIGIGFENSRAGVNVKLVSCVGFAGAILLNLLFAFFDFSQTSYVITMGITFLLYVLVANSLYGAQQ